MKRYVYIRVSTEKQSFERQHYIIKHYLESKGLSIYCVDAIVEEKISSREDITDRQFKSLMDRCEDGDYIYVDCLDRIGRNQVEMINLINDATKKGIYLVSCKDDRLLENKTEFGRWYMSIMTANANGERDRISMRTRDTLGSYQEQYATQGWYMNKKGEKVYRPLGRPPGPDGTYDMSAAVQASVKKRQERADKWRETSVGYATVKRWLGQGKSRKEILEEFNFQHKLQPKVYCTREGKPLSKGVLSKWIKEMGGQMAVIMEEAKSK